MHAFVFPRIVVLQPILTVTGREAGYIPIYPGQVSKYVVYFIVTETSVHDLQTIMQLRTFSSAATKTKHCQKVP